MAKGAGVSDRHRPPSPLAGVQTQTKGNTIMAKTQAVTPVTTTTIDPAGPNLTKSLLDVIHAGGKIRLPEQDDAQLAFDMLADRVTGDTAEALFSDTTREVVKPGEVIDRAFVLTDVELRNSDLDAYPDSIGVFAVLHVTIDGQDETMIAGGADVVLKAIRAKELGILPQTLMITETKTKSGRDVQNLVAAVKGDGTDGPF